MSQSDPQVRRDAHVEQGGPITYGTIKLPIDGETIRWPARSPWQMYLVHTAGARSRSRLALVAAGLMAVGYGLADIADAIRDRDAR